MAGPEPERGGSERREFVRVRMALSVRYAFVGADGNRLPPGISEGATANLSAGGLLLQGRVHDLAWVPELLTQRMAVAVSVALPTGIEPVKAVARACWIETVDPVSHRCSLGLRFKEITLEDQDRLFQFVIRSQLG